MKTTTKDDGRKRIVSSDAAKKFQKTWVKVDEDPDGTLYYEDPETGTVYMETDQGWIEA